MISNTTQTKIKELTDRLVEYNEAYYQHHQSLISDEQYDLLLKELEMLESEYPEYKLPYSPTNYVGSDLQSGFTQVKHVVPMQSLENTYNELEISQFVERVLEKAPEATFVTEFKLDGLSITAVYEDGVLTQVSTRGNGEVGDDVARNAIHIKGLPMRLKFPGTPPHIFELRGEAFMTFEDFRLTNKFRTEHGLEPLANPRNAASGTLKSLDQSVFQERTLTALFYHVALADELPQSQKDMFYLFDQLGIPHAPFYYGKNVADVLNAIGKIAQIRDQIGYPTDGAVIKLNEFYLRDRFGATSKYPRWAKAYKFAAEQARTKLRDITVQVGRTGVLTPVAELDPVELAGSTVKRATLHNADMIVQLGIRIGDIVMIEKAGEVIPHILCSIRHEPGSKQYWLYDAVHGHCPVCGTSIVRDTDKVAWCCPNQKCPARVEEQITYAVSKPALDIKGLGPKVVRAMIAKLHVGSLADLFRLRAPDLIFLKLEDGSVISESGKKIYAEIQKALTKDLYRWFVALGIPGVGPAVAKNLASRYLTLKQFQDEFTPRDNSVVEHNIETWLHPDGPKSYNALMLTLLNMNINPTNLSYNRNGPLQGKTFVLTGTLSLPRLDVVKMIEDQGGTVSSSVSKNTSFLVQGEDTRESIKAKKAAELSVPIISEQELQQLLNKQP